MNLEKDLYNLIGPSLHELAWRNNLSIHHNIGLWSFFEAFRWNKFYVEVKDKNATFNLIKDIEGKTYSLQTTLSLDEILNGWQRGPIASPHAFYDSICLVYDRMGEGFIRREEKNIWSNFRHYDSRETRKKMEENWLPYFKKHHEHMMMPVSGKLPELEPPKIIERVLSEYPIAVLQKAVLYRPSHGPTEDTLMEMDWEEFDEDYHPSEGTMVAYFWGHYLYELAKEKGYPINISDKENPLRLCVVYGDRAIKDGRSFLKK